MNRFTLLASYLIMSAFFITGCKTTEQFLAEPVAPVVQPFSPIIEPVDDTVQDIVAIHKIQPFGLDTTISVADKKQVRIAF